MVAPAIIALGGSLLYSDHDVKTWLGQLRQTIVHFEGNGRKIGLVIGGGKPAREGIQLAEHLISDRFKLDEIGIAATRLNATIIQQILIDSGCNVSKIIPKTTLEAAELLQKYNFVIMGGTVPGHTTDAVAVSFARDSGSSDCIIATNVNHIYDKDPRDNDDAEPYFEMTMDELVQITGTDRLKPGQSAVVDPIAVGIASQSKINIAVLDGRDLDLLESALDGKEFIGTIVRS